MNSAWFLLLGIVLLAAALVLLWRTRKNPPQPENEATPEPAQSTWNSSAAETSRRARRQWATTNGWQFDRDDDELADAWAQHVGANAGKAKDVLSGRVLGYRAHVADIGGTSYLAVARERSSDILIDARIPTETDSAPPRQGQKLVGACGSFAFFSEDPHSAQLLLDERTEAAMTKLQGATDAVVIDPWWILARTTARPAVSQLTQIFEALAQLGDAARVLPSITTERLDMSGGDPTRPYGVDSFRIGAGPRMQVVPELPEEPSPEDTIRWSDRPEVRREDVPMPRRDRGLSAQTHGEAESYGEIGENTGQLPAVGSDPDHTASHRQSGRVVRVETNLDGATIFGEPSAPGRHRKPGSDAPKSHRKEEDDPIINGEWEPDTTER